MLTSGMSFPCRLNELSSLLPLISKAASSRGRVGRLGEACGSQQGSHANGDQPAGRALGRQTAIPSQAARGYAECPVTRGNDRSESSAENRPYRRVGAGSFSAFLITDRDSCYRCCPLLS